MVNFVLMPKYEEYVNSGHEWVGEIPRNWELTKLGYCLSPVSIKNCPDLPLLSITRELGVIERDIEDQDSNHNFIPDDLSGYKKLEKGQFGMNKMKAWQGSYGVSKYTGIVSPAYFVFNFTKAINPEFFNWAIRSKLYVSFFGSASDGVRIGQWDLSKDRMKAIPFILPPEEEQIQIANFLVQKTEQIDEAIALKELQINLLKERKQIIIQKAVTQGLDPNVQLKNSGVDWIGKIPAHWVVVKLKTLIAALESGVSVNAYESEAANDGEVGVLKTSAVYKYCFDATQNKKVFPVETKRVSCPVKAGSIIISRMNAPDLVGASGYVEEDKPNLFLPDRLWQARFKSENKIVAKFISKSLITKGFRGVIESVATGSSPSMKNISKGDLLNIYVALPPETEFELIIKELEKQEKFINEAISIQAQLIEKLKEYKTTLINSAVAGKIKITPEMAEQ